MISSIIAKLVFKFKDDHKKIGKNGNAALISLAKFKRPHKSFDYKKKQLFQAASVSPQRLELWTH